MSDSDNLVCFPQEMLYTIFNALPTGIYFCDTECIIRFINIAYADYLGIKPQDAIGRPVKDFIPCTRAPIVILSGKAELGDLGPLTNGEKGKTLIVNRIPVMNNDGEVCGMISQALFSDPSELKATAAKIEQLGRTVSFFKEQIKSVLSARYSLDDILGKSAAISNAKELISLYARTDTPILIQGVTGVGKELFANALHVASPRADGPFVCINCGAIPHELFESELFGYSAGAFTGAKKEGKMGKIELSNKGTLFLDEVGEMPLSAQVKLLRILEDKMISRLGSTHPVRVDFRLVVATNRDLKTMTRDGDFREDLYYRLSAMAVKIPPLCERREDIPIIARSMLERLERGDLSFSAETMAILMRYNWPGNVRELRNVIERAASFCGGITIETKDLPAEIISIADAESELPCTGQNSLSSIRHLNERQLIFDTLSREEWNMARSARVLGISRATLYEKLKKYHITRSQNGGHAHK
jgi:transcriptional regulator with PAS, ATPase and Fis domain